LGDETQPRGHFDIQVGTGGEPADDVLRFLDREWDAYHRAEGHDMSYDWAARPVVLVARDACGEVVGAASGRVGAGVGHLGELMVAESRRGMGIGGELLAAFERHCEETGCHKLTVHTDLDGPAHRFYRRRGWLDEAVLRRDRGRRDFVRLYKFTSE
jgi:GNAT superfamily N-acetyltransferase